MRAVGAALVAARIGSSRVHLQTAISRRFLNYSRRVFSIFQGLIIMNKLDNDSIARWLRSFLLIAPLILLLGWLAQGSNADSSQRKSQSSSQNKPQNKKPSPEPGNKPSPEAVIDSTKFDFGEAIIGEELEHVFTVRNLGAAPLELFQGGPIAAIEGEPAVPFRRILLTGFDRSLASSLMPKPARLPAAPS